MNKSKRSTLLALTAAVSLVGCDRGERANVDTNPRNQPVSQAETSRQPADAPEQGAEVRADQDREAAQTETTATESREDQARKDDEFRPILAVPGTQVGEAPRLTPTIGERAEDQGEAKDDEDSRKQPSQQSEHPAPPQRQTAKPGLVSRVGHATTGAVTGTVAATGYYASALYHAWVPSKETKARRAALAAIREQKAEFREVKPSELPALKETIAQTRPDQERIAAIIKPNTETKRLLVQVLTEQNPEAVEGASERLVNEIFHVADDADNKVEQVQVALLHLAMNDAYDSAASSRVSLLSVNLDKRIVADDLQSTMKRGTLLIAATALAGAYGGYYGVERTAETLKAIPYRRGLAAAEDGVQKAGSARFWRRKKDAVVSRTLETKDAAMETGDSLFGRARRSFGRAQMAVRRKFVRPATPKELVYADLRDLLAEAKKKHPSLDVEGTIKKLNLKRTAEKHLPAPSLRQEHEEPVLAGLRLNETDQTGKPGMYVSLTNRLGKTPKLPNDQYRLVFHVHRDQATTQVFYSEPFVDQEAADLLKILKSTELPPRRLSVVDSSTGVPIPASDADTRRVLEALEKKGPGAVASGIDVKGKSRLAPTTETAALRDESLIKANDDIKGVVESTKAGKERLQKRVADKASQVAAFGERSLARVKGEEPFDPARAAVVASLVGGPAYFFSRSAYWQGRRAGEGYDSLYLEDLIPADRLHKVDVEGNEDARAAE